MIKNILLLICMLWTTTSNSALVSRIGGLAYYDTDADLTWLTDANYSQTSGYDTDGRMTWVEANAWAAGLTVGGVSGWRLPNTIDVGNNGESYTNIYQGVDFGYNLTTHSELSNMFYNVLGNTAWYDTNGVRTGCTAPNFCLTKTGPFSNIQTGSEYWSATEYAPKESDAWNFAMLNGLQSNSYKINDFYGWAVQSGDVSTVPIPAAAWLFGSGLIALVGMARRKG